ncbi:hemolysin family protein [uncultured Friedmanniella sp.]|uniref:hemolysin family protein n=1 Tax=uncultured Friedmanniella sp. TaxID=335381 RepID=UPI0035CAFCF2
MWFEWLMVLVGLVLTVGTGLFVASEFALVNLDRNDLENRRADGERRLDTTINALRITSTHLSGAQLGITLTTLLTGFTFEPAVSALLAGPLEGVGLPPSAVPAVGTVTGVALATLFSMVVGELVPKNLALALPVETAKLVLPFQTVFTMVFRPLIALFNNTANAIVRGFGIEPKEELSGARSAEELSSLVRRSAREGSLDAGHATLISRTLRFGDRTAADVMTPRVRMDKLRLDDSADDVLDLSRRTGRSRFPVIGEDADDIRGVVHIKQAFALGTEERRRVPAASLAVEPPRVPESMTTETLLGLLRREGFQLAVVVDEYGGTAGLVTLEDLVEELVGELTDEHDRARVDLVRLGDSFTFDAALRPDELVDRTGVEVPEDEEYETVGGFIADRLDRLPELGDEVALDAGTLRVERIDGGRVDRVRFTPAEVDPAELAEGHAETEPKKSRQERRQERAAQEEAAQEEAVQQQTTQERAGVDPSTAGRQEVDR